MKTENLKANQQQDKQNPPPFAAPAGSDDMGESQTAWDCYFRLGQIVESTTDAGQLEDIEYWAREIEKDARKKLKQTTTTTKGNTMQKAQIVETPNSFIVSAGIGECERHILKSNPHAQELARETAEWYDFRAVCLPEQLTDLLDGRDPMLVPINELARLSLLADGMLNAYISGIVDARRSLRAAGIEH